MNHILGLFFNPQAQWLRIAKADDSIVKHYLGFILLVAMIPVAGWYVGLVMTVALMAATVMLWSLGAMPVFT